MKKGVKMSLFSHNKKDKEKDKEKDKLNSVSSNMNNNNNNHHNDDDSGSRQMDPSLAKTNGQPNGKGTEHGEHIEDQQQANSVPNNQSSQNGAPAPGNKPKLVFHCQQAQGSPTGIISGFSNVKELYHKIANCYDFPPDDILFCTLNTHRIDMDNLLSAQLCLDDFIFVHRKGTKKEVEVVKSEEALGLTITDNGTGYAFIKRIKEDSIIDRVKSICVGDHIERITVESDPCTNLVGWRHVDVAKYLKAIPVGTRFVLRLVEPLRAGFANIGPKSDKSKRTTSKSGYGTGRETLRFRSNGPAQIETAPDDLVQTAIEKINRLLENYLGINDTDLATQIWEMADGELNTMAFAEKIDNSELESFGFTDDFIIDVWGCVSDVRLHSQKKDKSITDANQDEMNDEDLAYLMMNSTPGKKNRVK